MLLTLTWLVAAQLPASPQLVEIPGYQEFTGELLASPSEHATASEVSRALAPYTLVEHCPGPNRYVFALRDGESEEEAIQSLLETGCFAFVEPNWLVSPASDPSDPDFDKQWQHEPDRMNSSLAWNLHTGRYPVVINHCDSGVRTTHEDLRANRVESYNAVDRLWERDGGEVEDLNGHGTGTAGLIAATGNNARGVAGVGWNLRYRVSRVSNSSSGRTDLSTLLHAAEHGAELGDRVSSVGYEGVDSSAVRDSATYIRSIGGLLVWGAGNQGETHNWGDRDLDDLIVVGATESDDSRFPSSGRGRSVDFMAPGGAVYTTSIGSDQEYGRFSGTSAACSLAAGLFGLLFSANPTLTSLEAELLVKQGCDDLGTTGVDNTFGYGRIDCFETLSSTTVLEDDLTFLFSARKDVTRGSTTFAANDILRHRHGSGALEMVFDCSDVLSTSSNVDALARRPNGALLLSFADDGVVVPGVGLVDDEDLVLFTPTSLGDTTAGAFLLYFDGSDVGLGDREGEDVTGVAVDEATGHLFLTCKGRWNVPGLATGRDEDILEFVPTSLGGLTFGLWRVAFDGNEGLDERLGSKGEEIDALDYLASLATWCLSTSGSFKVSPNGLEGSDNDLLHYMIDTPGPQGTGFQVLTYLGDPNGLSDLDLDALHVEEGAGR